MKYALLNNEYCAAIGSYKYQGQIVEITYFNSDFLLAKIPNQNKNFLVRNTEFDLLPETEYSKYLYG